MSTRLRLVYIGITVAQYARCSSEKGVSKSDLTTKFDHVSSHEPPFWLKQAANEGLFLNVACLDECVHRGALER